MTRTFQIAPANSSFEGRVVSFETKKGTSALTVEGAIFKGGKALAAVRSAAAEVALNKALGGRYRSAAELIATSLPASFMNGFQKFAGDPSANKMLFTIFCEKVLGEMPKNEAKGWTEKQQEARSVARAFIDEVARVAAEKAAKDGEAPAQTGLVIENGAQS
jgi:hypothetical protein